MGDPVGRVSWSESCSCKTCQGPDRALCCPSTSGSGLVPCQAAPNGRWGNWDPTGLESLAVPAPLPFFLMLVFLWESVYRGSAPCQCWFK